MTPQTNRIDAILAEMRALAPAGFAAALHLAYAGPRYVFQTYKPEWMAFYSGTGVVMNDPAVRWSLSNDGIAKWEDLEAMDDHDVFGTARRFGMEHWAVVSTSDGGSQSMGAFARDDRPFWDTEKARALELLLDAHSLTRSASDDADFAAYLTELSIRLTHQSS